MNVTENPIRANLSEVDRLLLDIVLEGKKAAPRFKEQPGADDWGELLKASLRHGVFPYLYRAVNGAGGGRLGPQIQARLKNQYYLCQAGAAHVIQDLKQILESFAGVDIRCILLKGPYLAENVYPHSDLRLYTDLDILVQGKDVYRATDCLSSLGYESIPEDAELAAKELRGQKPLAKNGVQIDLHWELINDGLYRTTIDYWTDEVFAAGREIDFLGQKIVSLSPRDLIIYQALHLSSQHAFAKLMWFNDLRLILDKFQSQLDWDEFIATVVHHRLAAQVYYALWLTKELMDAQVPQPVLAKLKPKLKLARLFEFLLGRTSVLELTGGRRNPANQVWLFLRDDWRLSSRAFLWRVFPSVEWFLHYYPFLPRLKRTYYYPLYPALMLLRLVRRPIGQT